MNRCPDCGAEGTGSFCSSCGASLTTQQCTSCAMEVPPGSRFCVHCGAPTGSQPTPLHPAAAGAQGAGRGALGWWVAGILLVGLVVVVAVPRLLETGSPETPRTPAVPQGSAALGPAPNVDLSSMTPREAADRLWNRVMRGAEMQDSTEILNFVPMAVSAYELARPLDADGLFHLSVLLRLGQDMDGALAAAEEVLVNEPTHLLSLGAAAEAAEEAGLREEADGFWRRFLAAYDSELATGREEYEVHADLLPRMRSDAQAFLEGR